MKIGILNLYEFIDFPTSQMSIIELSKQSNTAFLQFLIKNVSISLKEALKELGEYSAAL